MVGWNREEVGISFRDGFDWIRTFLMFIALEWRLVWDMAADADTLFGWIVIYFQICWRLAYVILRLLILIQNTST